MKQKQTSRLSKSLTAQSAGAAEPVRGLRLSGLTRAGGHVAQAGVLICLLASGLLRPVLSEALLALLLLSLAAGFFFLGRGLAAMRPWALYILGWSLFVSLRTFADATGMPVGFDYPIEASEILLGTALSPWLQERLYSGAVGVLDVLAFLVYSSYFVLHYLLALALWIWRRDSFRVFTTAVIATLFLGLVGYYLVPTAPPWLASEEGQLSSVVRIPEVVSNYLATGSYESGAAVAGSNDVAAMPSLHTAVTVVIALTLWRHGRLVGVLGWLYAAAMGFVLIYLGEHYLIDVLAGSVLALIVFKVAAGPLVASRGHLSPLASVRRVPSADGLEQRSA